MTALWAAGGALAGVGAGVALRGPVSRFTRVGWVFLLVSAVVVAALAARFAGSVEVLAFATLGALGVALAFIDAAVERLPDVLTLPAYPIVVGLLAVAAVVSGRLDTLWRALLGGLVLFVFYFALGAVRPGDLGGGDVKLAGVLGVGLAWLGWQSLALGAALGFVLSAVVSLVLLAARRITLRSQLPFGPFMLAGALVAVLLS
ncbi:hypothetical protein Lesp02_80190 [Lentzea sp. NBRC 105346]|uniref:prepilin peptidase n=1 Tax=Lentzea sp. NBRC 105346 TaxID=3032205 RepID=UPI0024A3F169|nr:A24 family peptidase [Lentzea sp. NBRC 105346]GLZ35832.1 hypothetical protein Lesp02_80190 [Lentzea sp. NBRC 105346]